MTRVPAARARQRGFFDFSFPELVITFGVALVVLGPKKLPGLVQQVGRWVGRARHMARQFREQLESEVNSINAVKPVPMKPPPEVGPVAPPAATYPEPAPEPVHEAHTDTSVEAAPTPAPQPVAEQVHPEAQIYFAMNGSQPEIVSRDPYAVEPAADDPQALAAPADSADSPPAARAPGADEAAKQPASVEVIFPHDHG